MKNKKIDENRIKIHFQRKFLYLSSASFVLSVAMIWAVYYIPTSKKYPRQVVGFLAILFFILGIIFLLKLFTKEIRRELYRRVGRVFSAYSHKIIEKFDALLTRLGISTATKHSGKDERDIYYENDTPKRRRWGKRFAQKKYSDLENNKERIRYIWSKFIINRVTRDNTPHIYDTPIEMMKRFSEMNESENDLYNSYLNARYTNDNVIIEAETVNKQYKFVSDGKKI